jgi:uncharacterized protein (DUF1499 family)
MAESEVPRSARAASWLGKFSPSCALAGLVGIHLGLVPPLGGFMFFQIGLLCALLALIAGAVAFFSTRDDIEGPGRKGAWMGLASGMLIITAAIIGAWPGRGNPPINDITTNLDDPPEFATAALVPDYTGRDMGYPVEFVEIVRTNYAYLKPIQIDAEPAAAFAKAISVGEELGWTIVHQDEEGLRFDAQDQSTAFKFIDDVTVRIQPGERGSTIDVRSKSRDGKGDLGANAQRIVAFGSALAG